MVGDVRDMFLENGMSDFLAKPLERKEIERVLCQWLPTGKWSVVRRAQEEPASSIATDTFN